MSAWILSKRHITTLVDGAIDLGLITLADATKTGRMLTNANKRSIRARYGRWDEEASRVETYWYPGRSIKYERPAGGAMLCYAGCYDYQTCEYSGYETSVAGRFIKRMERALEAGGARRGDPDYEAAPWGL